MAVDIPGIISVVVFYVVIMVIGIIAGRKTSKANTSEELFVANRNIGLVISFFTLTATAVGGGYINGTAESMAYNGLIWTQAPVGYFISFMIAGLAYAKRMRTDGYITMFDPFQLKYGKKVGALLFIPQLLGDLFWGASILAALGATLSIILDVNKLVAIIVSAAVAIIYTFFGGLYAVAYTDVIQLTFIFVGLILAVPFAMSHEAVNLDSIEGKWIGHLDPEMIGVYVDVAFLLICGGIPWQVFYQRVLACKTPKSAVIASVGAATCAFLFAIPPSTMGIVGLAADWNKTRYDGPLPIPPERRSFVLPMVLEYLCPVPVALLGMGSLAAAVMSSADSCILSAATVFTHNIYKAIIRPGAKERESLWVLRIAIIVVGVLATFIAIIATSVYALFVLCSDLMFVVLFPQLTCVLWMDKSNAYGCLSGFLVSLLLRISAGETSLGIPPLLKFPYYHEEHGQLFPFRTFIMLVGSFMLIGVSLLTDFLFRREILPSNWDVLKIVERSGRLSDFRKAGAEKRRLKRRDSDKQNLKESVF